MPRNNLAFWFPKLEAVGLKVPRTVLVHTDAHLIDLLDGETPEGWTSLIAKLRDAGDAVGWPCFLRTGYGSGKHEWRRTCYVESAEDMPNHVVALVEWSHLVDIMGLPTQDWAVRELIPTAPLFTCRGFDGFPVTREFRVFVRDGKIAHVQPYWPLDAVAQGRPDVDDWAERLLVASRLTNLEYAAITWTALMAGDAVGGGYWSVDLLQDREGDWWLTDMAEGDRSFRYDAEVGVAS